METAPALLCGTPTLPVRQREFAAEMAWDLPNLAPGATSLLDVIVNGTRQGVSRTRRWHRRRPGPQGRGVTDRVSRQAAVSQEFRRDGRQMLGLQAVQLGVAVVTLDISLTSMALSTIAAGIGADRPPTQETVPMARSQISSGVGAAAMAH